MTKPFPFPSTSGYVISDPYLVDVCEKCGDRRYDLFVFLGCRCDRKLVGKLVYSKEEEAQICVDLEIFAKHMDKVGYSHGMHYESVKLFIEFANSMGPISQRLILHNSRARVYRIIAENIDIVRTNIQFTAREPIRISLKVARLIGYRTFQHDNPNGSPCVVKCATVGLCSLHIGWFYVMHNELLVAGLIDNVARICGQYLFLEYDSIPGCIPSPVKYSASRKAAAPRKADSSCEKCELLRSKRLKSV